MEQIADLELWLQRQIGDSYRVVASFRAPDSRADTPLVTGAPVTIQLATAALRKFEADPAAYSTELTAALLADERLRSALVRSFARAREAAAPLRLRLRLNANDPVLYGLRWELLLAPEGDPPAPLGADAKTYLVRYVVDSSVKVADPPARPAPRALVALAAPDSLPEAARLADLDRAALLALLPAAMGDLTPLTLEQATWAGVRAALESGPAVVYLACHAVLRAGQVGLYFADGNGASEVINAPMLTSFLRKLPTRPLLVVLSPTQSSGSGRASEHALLKLAPQLLQVGVPAVIALPENIAQPAVAAGMARLLRDLQRDGHVERAIARLRQQMAVGGEDWWQPALFTRRRAGRLWNDPPPAPDALAALTPPAFDLLRLWLDVVCATPLQVAAERAAHEQAARTADLLRGEMLIGYLAGASDDLLAAGLAAWQPPARLPADERPLHLAATVLWPLLREPKLLPVVWKGPLLARSSPALARLAEGLYFERISMRRIAEAEVWQQFYPRLRAELFTAECRAGLRNLAAYFCDPARGGALLRLYQTPPTGVPARLGAAAPDYGRALGLLAELV